MRNASARADESKVVLLPQIDSTNAEGLRRAASGERGPLWLRALEQSAGRGRRGRVWQSDAGNLFATLIITPDCDLETASGLAFVTGLAVYDAIAAVAPEAAGHLLLKWPNDVLAGNSKIAGILIETSRLPADPRTTLAIGIGINVVSRADGNGFASACIADYNPAANAEACMRALIDAMDARLGQWAEGSAFAEIRSAWLSRTAPIDRMKRVDIGGRVVDGAFAGIDEKGALLLRTEQGEIRVTAGDVFFS